MKDNDNSCVVIHLDSVFTPEGSKEHKLSIDIRNLLLLNSEYDLEPSLYFEKKYYKEIIKYLNKKKLVSYIEGGNIAEIQNISNIIGTVIVKRTGLFKCFLEQ